MMGKTEIAAMVRVHRSKEDGTMRGAFHRETADMIEALSAQLAASEAARVEAEARNPLSAAVMLERAYLAGFNASGEGYNAEFPFQDNGTDPDQDEEWVANRAIALAALEVKP